MNRYEQETHNNIKRIAVALEQLAKLLTKLAKEQNDQNKRRNTTSRIN